MKQIALESFSTVLKTILSYMFVEYNLSVLLALKFKLASQITVIYPKLSRISLRYKICINTQSQLKNNALRQ